MRKPFNRAFLHQCFVVLLAVHTFLGTAYGQNTIIATAPGQASLSQEMINQYRSIYEFLLEIKLSKQQSVRLQNGLAQYWKKNEAESIGQVLGDLKYYGRQDELESLRLSNQKTFVEAFRRDATDSVSRVLTEAYDMAHPDRAESTKAKSFADLVGVWKRSDALLAEKTYSGQPAGISYTETETIEIFSNGKFKHVKVHSHYSGACSQIDGKTEYGTVKMVGVKLIFEIQSGTQMVKDDCMPALNQQKKIKPRRESFPWTVKPNPGNNNVLTVCLNTGPETAVCLEKQ